LAQLFSFFSVRQASTYYPVCQFFIPDQGYDHLAVFLRKERDENNNQTNEGASGAFRVGKKNGLKLQ